MSRSIWKGPFIENSFLKKEYKIKKKNTVEIKTWSRKSTILPYLVGKSILIHNGKKFLKIKISENMLGHKLGEFAPTRARFFYKKKKKEIVFFILIYLLNI
jgi:small subunit ribosomal protein S19